jgi:hypothetical protein
MTNQPLTTIGLVRAYMQEIHIIKDKQITDEDLGWFNCRWCADIILNHYNADEIANIFASGIQPSKNIDSLQQVLDTHFGPQLTIGQFEEANLVLKIQIAKFIGNTKIKSELEEQLLTLQNS